MLCHTSVKHATLTYFLSIPLIILTEEQNMINTSTEVSNNIVTNGVTNDLIKDSDHNNSQYVDFSSSLEFLHQNFNIVFLNIRSLTKIMTS